VSGEIVDLFTRQRLNSGEVAPTMDDFDTEAEFIEQFMFTYMSEFLAEVTLLEEVETVEELEGSIRAIRGLVSQWPRFPRR
jgi:hypothetical protein